MNNKKNKVFWIASYPKSGNTWIRSIISTMFRDSKGIFNFNYLDNIKAFDIPSRYEFVKNLNKSDYNNLEDLNILSKYWLQSQERFHNDYNFFDNVSFFKTHSANINLDNKQFTNTVVSVGLIYIIRDPRDMIISCSKHYDKTIDTMIDYVSNEMNILRTSEKKYPILISTPTLHYKSWKNLNFPKLIIKYENLLSNPSIIIKQIMQFFQIYFKQNFTNEDSIIKNIVETTAFNKMRKYEKIYGFKEAPYSSQNKKFKEFFFRAGTKNQWKKILTTEQRKKIESTCYDLMEEFKYFEN